MCMIEVHSDGIPRSITVQHIVAVKCPKYGNGCEIFTVDSSAPWNVDESYQEVLRMITVATV